MKPKISVIIPTYNRAGILNRAIQSVFNQTFRDFELIVVDDGSTDDTARSVASLPSIKYLSQNHSGVSKARNLGIEHARGEWLAFLDSDDKWLPEKLERQINYANAHPEIRIFHSLGTNFFFLLLCKKSL